MGSAYAYHPRRRAPANRLSAPTGAKFRFCAMRAKAAITVSPIANGLAVVLSTGFSPLRLSIKMIIHQAYRECLAVLGTRRLGRTWRAKTPAPQKHRRVTPDLNWNDSVPTRFRL